MIKAIIVDDDAHCRESLGGLILSSFPHIRVIAACKSVDEGRSAILELKPDLVFLDVEMPPKTGFDLVRELEDAAFDLDIIFTTAHEKYALQAIKASATDFLLKPIGENDLREALTRLEKKRSKEQVAKQVEVLLQHSRKDKDPNKNIALPTLTGFVFEKINNIIRCQSDDNYSTFFFSGNRKIVSSQSLKHWEEVLAGYGFLRVHNSHLINMNHLKEYIKGEGGIVKMNDGSEIPVSRRKKDEFLLMLGQM